jgi:hypothetical protein
MTQADCDLARIVERGELPAAGFPHASHLRVACVHLAEAPSTEAAAARTAGAIRRLAVAIGQSEKYHETMTRGWVQLLALACAAAGSTDFDVVAARFPALLDKNLLLTFYSRERLDSAEARASFVEPDLRSLSIDATCVDSIRSSGHASDRAVPR